MMKSALSLFAVAAVAGGLTAQGATYRSFAEGCNGSPMSNCVTQNDAAPVMTVSSLPNEYAYPVINTTGVPIQVVGFETFTVTNNTTTNPIPVATGETGILFDLSGPAATVHTRPDPTNVANGTITVTSTQGWYSTAVYPPVTIGPGVAFWIHQDAYSRIAPPQHVAAGGVAGPTSSWYRRPSNNNVWTVSVSVVRPIFRIHCVAA